MNTTTSQNLLGRAAQNRSRNQQYWQYNKAVPKQLHSKIARRVENGALTLLLQVVDQTAMPIFVETQLTSGTQAFQHNEMRVSLFSDQSQSSWVVTYPTLCGEDHALELFDHDGMRLCKIMSDEKNMPCWSQLLDALPSNGSEFEHE